MHRRKIQLIAGTTYSVSLPKDWVLKNNLKEKSEVVLFERSDRSLVVSPHSVPEQKLNEASIDIDKYINSIDQVIFALYYHGIENINIFSKKELTKDVKTRIRRTMTHMSGTEISYEDKQKISIKVLLDMSKVDIVQILYRIILIIDSSIQNIRDEMDMNEVRMNEEEIDRLYHLIAKIVSISLIESNVLYSSKIKNVCMIPAYFLMSKRLENLADNLYHLSDYMSRYNIDFSNKAEILNLIRIEMNRSIEHIMGKQSNVFEIIDPKTLKTANNMISKIKDDIIQHHFEDIIRFVIDIQEEIVNISLHNQLPVLQTSAGTA